MKIRLFSQPPVAPRDLLLDHLKRCNTLVDQYLEAKKTRNRNAANAARIELSLFVPTGVYVRGDDPAREMYAVLGVQESRTSVNRERHFFALYTRIHGHGDIDAGWERSALIDIDGFLVPVCRDGYHGARFIRVGELLHR